MWIRKKEVLELSKGIRRAIDGENFDPRDNREGAFSVLKNDIYTLIHLEQDEKLAAVEEKRAPGTVFVRHIPPAENAHHFPASDDGTDGRRHRR